MFKHLSICATLLAAAMGPANAQQQEAVLQRIATSGADFDIVLAMPKSPPQWMDDLNMSPDALIVHLIGGELVLAFDDADKMLKAAEVLEVAGQRLSLGAQGRQITHTLRCLCGAKG